MPSGSSTARSDRAVNPLRVNRSVKPLDRMEHGFAVPRETDRPTRRALCAVISCLRSVR